MSRRPEAVRRLGVFGGTFDPLHVGHLIVAQEVLEGLSLDRVLFVPTYRSPLKTDDAVAPPATRLRMLSRAIEGDASFQVSDLEIRREGPSYTVETLRDVASEWPGARLVLVLGADQWVRFGEWRRPREIASMAELALMAREGDRPSALEPQFADGPPPPSVEVSVTRIDLSATRIRARVREGRSIRYLVPEPVRRIIEAEDLYVKTAREGEEPGNRPSGG